MPAGRTLGELKAELLARLGFGATGAAAGAAAAHMVSLLQNAQVQLYWMMDWRHLQRWSDKVVPVDAKHVDLPEDAHPLRISKVAVRTNGSTQDWRTLRDGIEVSMHSTWDGSPGTPSRYEVWAGDERKLWLWPKTDQPYILRAWYVQDLPRFAFDGDRPLIDADLVLLHALANGKAHYRQPDAQFYTEQFGSLLARVKGGAWGERTFNSSDPGRFPPDPYTDSIPRVVGRDT